MVRRRWKAQGGSAREGQALPPRCISGPVPGTSSRLGHKRDPQLPAVAFTERTFVKRVSFNFACKKIILHIFCTSLTVPIEPGPCGFAEGRGHDFLRPQPHPRGEGGIGKRRQQPGNREPGGRAGGRLPCSFAQRPSPRPSAGATEPSLPAQWRPVPSVARSGTVCPPGRVSQFWTKPGGAELLLGGAFVLWFDIFLDSMLQFSFFWFFVSFKFCFSRGRGGRKCLQSSVATHLVFTFANVNQV